jgi:hypothetical protein
MAQAQGDDERAASALQRSARLFRELGNLLEHARTLAAQAELKGNPSASQSACAEARTIFQQFGAQLDLQYLDTSSQSTTAR